MATNIWAPGRRGRRHGWDLLRGAAQGQNWLSRLGLHTRIRTVERPPPERLFQRCLETACHEAIDAVATPRLHVEISCRVDGEIAETRAPTVLTLVREVVRTAVAQGMQDHLIGTVSIQINAGVGAITVEITDDGWACTPRDLQAARAIVECAGGHLTHEVSWAFNVTKVQLPIEGGTEYKT